MASIFCPLCGATVSGCAKACANCGYSLNICADDAVQKPGWRWDLEPDEDAINRMGDALLDFGAIYGWETAEEIWWDTKGLVTNVENTLSMYPKRTDIPDEDLKEIVQILRSYPDPDVIAAELGDCASKTKGGDSDNCLDPDTVHELRNVLERHAKEQQQINLQNAHDYERLEAILETRKIDSRE